MDQREYDKWLQGEEPSKWRFGLPIKFVCFEVGPVEEYYGRFKAMLHDGMIIVDTDAIEYTRETYEFSKVIGDEVWASRSWEPFAKDLIRAAIFDALRFYDDVEQAGGAECVTAIVSQAVEDAFSGDAYLAALEAYKATWETRWYAEMTRDDSQCSVDH